MTIDEAKKEIRKHWGIGQPNAFIWEMLAEVLDIVEQRTGGGLPQDESVSVLKAKIAELDSLLNNDAAIFQAIKDVLGRDDLTAAQLPAEIKLRLK